MRTVEERALVAARLRQLPATNVLPVLRHKGTRAAARSLRASQAVAAANQRVAQGLRVGNALTRWEIAVG